jgi:hypothetical protein
MALICCDLCNAKRAPGTIAYRFPGKPKVCFICQGDEFDPYGELDACDAAAAAPAADRLSAWDAIVIVTCAVGQGAVWLLVMLVAFIWISFFDDPTPPLCNAGSVAALFTNCEVAQ